MLFFTHLTNSMPLFMKLIILTRAPCSKLIKSISPPLALFLYDPFNYCSLFMTQGIEYSVVSGFWYLIIYMLTLFVIRLEPINVTEDAGFWIKLWQEKLRLERLTAQPSCIVG